MALDQDLPEWLEQGTESSLRDTEDDIQPPGIVQAVSRSITSTSRGPTPIVLTPTRGHSPAATGNPPAPWTDLDQFYADVDEVAESDNDGDDGTDDGEDDREASSVSEPDNGSGSADEETDTESEGSVIGQGILEVSSHSPV
jgi:AP-3 complex subunit beta